MPILKCKIRKMTMVAICVVLAITLLLMFSINNRFIAFAQETSDLSGVDEKAYSNASIYENFDDSTVIVVMNQSIGAINKRQDKTIFKGVDIEKVTDLTIVDENSKSKKYLKEESFKQILEIKLPTNSKEKVLEVVKQLEQIDGVYSAEPNYYGQATLLPANSVGTGYSNLWGMHNPSYGIKAPLAWDITTGSADIQVAIIDTGVAAHENLNANLATGWNFVDNNSNTNDTAGHGTHVAGTIGATEGTANGVVGVNWNVTLVPLTISNTVTNWQTKHVVNAINWARNNGIPIINFSGGGFGPSALESAIAGYGGLFVTSAGNNTNDNDTSHYYPSDYSRGQTWSNRVVSVGAINNLGNIAGFSNFGAESVSIFAPGVGILSTVPNAINATGYASWQGTSMATPHVAGVAALLLSHNPYLTAEEIKAAIINNADYNSNLDGLCVSNGQLNAYKALKSIKAGQEVFGDFGYKGSSFYWNGGVKMEYDSANIDSSSSTLKVVNNTQLQFELYTKSSSNAIAMLNGTVNFELKNSSGAILQTHETTVKVNLVNNVTLTDNSFTIDTSSLINGTYTLKMTSNFERATWEESSEQTYTFIVNKPEKIIGDFGYTSSWYKWNGNVKLTNDYLYAFGKNSSGQMIVNRSTTLNFEIGTDLAFNAVTEITSNISFVLRDSAGNVVNINGNSMHNATSRVGLVSNVSYTGRTFSINTADLANDTYTLTLTNTSSRSGTTYTQSKIYVFEVNKSTSCVSEGTLITLADGSQVEVEELTGNEQILVWNMITGQFDSAPILFIDSDAYSEYEIIKLIFSDGTSVKVIDEHGFFNTTLNEYVFLRSDASQYIGDWFNKQSIDDNGDMIWTTVQLTDVDVYNEYTTAWSPVTYGYLCYYVNGMLSMPGATTGFINIFDVDATTMTIDQVTMQADIEEYGLFTYEEFAELIPVPELVFDAFNGKYLKVSIGKGLITIEEIGELFERYASFFDVETEEEIEETIIESGNNGNHNGQNKGNGKGNGHNK